MKVYLSLVGALGLGVGLLAGSSVAAQDQANLTAAVHAGSCAEPGESVRALDAFRPGRGQAVGVSGVPIVLESSTDDIAGLSGRQLIRTSTPSLEQPSTSAASSSSCGMDMKKPISSHVQKGMVKPG